MEKSLYQKQQQNVMEYIPYGSFLYHIFTRIASDFMVNFFI